MDNKITVSILTHRCQCPHVIKKRGGVRGGATHSHKRKLSSEPHVKKKIRHLGMAELNACVARFMKVIIRNLATHPDAENRLKKPKQSFVFEFSASNNFLVRVNYT